MEIENNFNLENEAEKVLSQTDTSYQSDMSKRVNFTIGIVDKGKDSLLLGKKLLGINLNIGFSSGDKFFNIRDIVSETPEILEDGKRGNQKKFYDRFVKIPKNLRSRIIK